MMKSQLTKSMGHKGSAPINRTSVATGGGSYMTCRPEAGAGPMSSGLHTTSVGQGRAAGKQPVPKQMPKNNTPGPEPFKVGVPLKPTKLGALRRT